MTYSTTIHGPAASAPSVTGRYARCAVCGAEWQVLDEDGSDAEGCPVCDAPKAAISVHSEAATFGGATVYGGGEV